MTIQFSTIEVLPKQNAFETVYRVSCKGYNTINIYGATNSDNAIEMYKAQITKEETQKTVFSQLREKYQGNNYIVYTTYPDLLDNEAITDNYTQAGYFVYGLRRKGGRYPIIEFIAC